MESGADSWVNWSKFTGLHGNHNSMPASALTKYNKNLENTLYIYIYNILWYDSFAIKCCMTECAVIHVVCWMVFSLMLGSASSS